MNYETLKAKFESLYCYRTIGTKTGVSLCFMDGYKITNFKDTAEAMQFALDNYQSDLDNYLWSNGITLDEWQIEQWSAKRNTSEEIAASILNMRNYTKKNLPTINLLKR